MAQAPQAQAHQVVEVVDDTGAHVEGAAVVVERGTAPYPEVARRTGKSGTLKYFLPDGDFELVAQTPDGRTARGRMTVKNGNSPPLVLRLARGR